MAKTRLALLPVTGAGAQDQPVLLPQLPPHHPPCGLPVPGRTRLRYFYRLPRPELVVGTSPGQIQLLGTRVG